MAWTEVKPAAAPGRRKGSGTWRVVRLWYSQAYRCEEKKLWRKTFSKVEFGLRMIVKFHCLLVNLHCFFPFATGAALLLLAAIGDATSPLTHRSPQAVNTEDHLGGGGGKSLLVKKTVPSIYAAMSWLPLSSRSWKEPLEELSGSHRLRRPGPPRAVPACPAGLGEPCAFPSAGDTKRRVAGTEGDSRSRPAGEAAEGGRTAAATGRRCWRSAPAALAGPGPGPWAPFSGSRPTALHSRAWKLLPRAAGRCPPVGRGAGAAPEAGGATSCGVLGRQVKMSAVAEKAAVGAGVRLHYACGWHPAGISNAQQYDISTAKETARLYSLRAGFFVCFVLLSPASRYRWMPLRRRRANPEPRRSKAEGVGRQGQPWRGTGVCEAKAFLSSSSGSRSSRVSLSKCQSVLATVQDVCNFPPLTRKNHVM